MPSIDFAHRNLTAPARSSPTGGRAVCDQRPKNPVCARSPSRHRPMFCVSFLAGTIIAAKAKQKARPALSERAADRRGTAIICDAADRAPGRPRRRRQTGPPSSSAPQRRPHRNLTIAPRVTQPQHGSGDPQLVSIAKNVSKSLIVLVLAACDQDGFCHRL